VTPAPELPPHDEQAERALLSAFLEDPVAAARFAGPIFTDDLFVDAHRPVFRAVLAVASRGTAPSGVLAVAPLVRAELERRGHAAASSAVEVLADVAPLGINPANAGAYADVVRRHAAGRRVLQVARDAVELAPTDGTAALALLRDRVAQEVASFAEPGRALAVRTGAALLEEQDVSTDDLWTGTVALGLFTLFAALAKCGKSWLLMSFAASIASGRSWLGLEREPLGVLYVTEEGTRTLRPRVRRFGAQAVAFVTPADLPAAWTWPQKVAAIFDRAEADGAKVVIVDTVLGLAGMGPEAANDDGAARAVLDPLARGATVRGLAVVAVHHARKDDAAGGRSILGGNAFRSIPDVLAELRHHGDEDGPDRELTLRGRLDDGAGKLILRHVEGTDGATDGYQVLGTPADARAAKIQTKVRDVLQAEEAWLEREALLDLVKGRRCDVIAAVAALVAKDVIRTKGSGAKGDPKAYGRLGLLASAPVVLSRATDGAAA
jgi:hypothetical protein